MATGSLTDVEIVKEKISATSADIPSSIRTLDGFYFFVSLDLANSTVYKTKRSDWPLLISQFYNVTAHEINKIQNSKLWKYVGDEVLYYKKIRTQAELLDAVRGSYAAMHAIVAGLHNSFPLSRAEGIGVKATAWVANCKFVAPTELEALQKNFSENEVPNLILSTPHDQSRNDLDFLGPDIDTGFRIAKFAWPNVLVLNVELAALLKKNAASDESDKIRITHYEKLKGVWSGRLYPIIWYCDQWSDFEKLFTYEHLQEKTPEVQRAQKAAELQLKGDLDNILRDTGRLDNCERTLSALSNFSVNSEDDTNLVPAEPLPLEVHCVAVVFDQAGKLLLGQRPKDKKILPNKWEFGCGQLEKGKSFLDSIKEHYKADFGADLTFFEEHPFKQYFMADNGKSGVIFVAEISNPTDVEKKFSPSKHQKIEWASCEEALSKNPNDCVDGFHTTVRTACEIWSKKE